MSLFKIPSIGCKWLVLFNHENLNRLLSSSFFHFNTKAMQNQHFSHLADQALTPEQEASCMGGNAPIIVVIDIVE